MLAEFLREVKCIAEVQAKQDEVRRLRVRRRRHGRRASQGQGQPGELDRSLDDLSEEGTIGADNASDNGEGDGDGYDEYGNGNADDRKDGEAIGDGDEEWQGEGSGSWQPGQGVYVDHGAIMDIVINHLSYPGRSELRVTIHEIDRDREWL